MSLGQRIEHARKLSGRSYRELAGQVGVSYNAIWKYAQDMDYPSSSVLLRLAQALGVSPDYFFREITVTLGKPSFRCKPELSCKEEKQLLARIEDWLERLHEAEMIFEAEGSTGFKFPRGFPIKVHNFDEIERAAERLRQVWRIGIDAIDDLIALMEDKRLRVYQAELARPFDGLIVSVTDEEYVVAINGTFSGDHQRFSLAHELGHLMLKPASNLDSEKAAYRFAAAFLVPEAVAISRLGKQRSRLDLQELHLIKHEYGFSMQAWVRRAQELGILPDSHAKALLSRFKKNGWDHTEPGDQYRKERPQRLERLVYRAMAEGLISESRAEELLNQPLSRNLVFMGDKK